MICELVRPLVCGAFISLVIAGGAGTARAQEAIRIAVDDPFSGGNGNVGEEALKEFFFYADKINAAGGVGGRKIEIVPFDNKSDPQEALVQAQKAIDQGFHIIAQGISASAVGAALTDFVAKHNDRNPDKKVLYLNFAANDGSLTNDKCEYWHFRFSAHTDMRAAALMGHLASQANIKKVYLINPDYTAGRAARDLSIKSLKEKRPDIQVVGDDLFPVFKVSDFSPHIGKVKAAGADAVISSAFAQDIALLMKAAADAGLSADWYTFYAQNPGVPTAMKQAKLANRDFNLVDSFPNNPASMPLQIEFRDKYGFSVVAPGAILSLQFLLEAVKQTNSTNPVVLAKALEGMKFKTFNGDEAMLRADDHQLFQNLYVANFGPVTAEAPLDEEGTGWGWLPVKTVPMQDTLLPTTCQMQRP
jgi:branched-chain amino acid transport system substrate-binding protein